jgi:nucleoside-diphosphate-sugar epimerase
MTPPVVLTPDPLDLDASTRGVYEASVAAAQAEARRLILVSDLSGFARYPRPWRIGPDWRPRPAPMLPALNRSLAERSVQEVARATGLPITIVRCGDGVDRDAALADARADTALFQVVHVGDDARRPDTDDGRPWRERFAPPEPIPSRPIRRVAVLGAGGPIGAAVARHLAPQFLLRLCDIRPLAQIAAEARPQSPGAPIAAPLPPPHEEAFVDLRDPATIAPALDGCDAVINLTVIRNDPVDAFAVNTTGAVHLCRALVEAGIRRFVQTGPQMITLHRENDFGFDFALPSDTPCRPGRHLYGHSKFLGNEACRIFAEWHDLEVPVLLFNNFATPGVDVGRPHAMMLSYDDAARAIGAALTMPDGALGSPYEEFHIVADYPHDQCRTDKAQRLLGWRPLDALDALWRTGGA